MQAAASEGRPSTRWRARLRAVFHLIGHLRNRRNLWIPMAAPVDLRLIVPTLYLIQFPLPMGRAAVPALLIVAVLVSVRPVSSARTPVSSPSQPAASVASSSPRQFIDTHCVACHNDRARTAGLTLSGIDVADVSPNAELWEKVLHKIRTGQMPPAGRPRPDRLASSGMMPGWRQRWIRRPRRIRVPGASACIG